MSGISFKYPAASSGGGSGSNASVGTNNATAPTSSTEVGFVDSGGNLQPFSGTSAASGPNVAVTSSALPAGASTSALQTTGNSSLATIATNTTGVATAANQTTGNSSLATIATNTTGVATAANQTTGNNSLATIATNSGTQATAANQTTGNASLATIVTNSSATQGSVAAGTAATKSDLIGGVFNTTLPTLTNGQQAGLQVDSSGRQILGTSAATIGTINIAAAQTLANVTTVSTVTTVSAVTAITNALPAGTNNIGKITAGQGTLTDNSSTTSATPSTSTTIMASNASRKYLLIQNLSASATIYINFTSAANAGSGSYAIAPLGSLVQESTFVSTEAVTVLSTSASVPYTAKQA